MHLELVIIIIIFIIATLTTWNRSVVDTGTWIVNFFYTKSVIFRRACCYSFILPLCDSSVTMADPKHISEPLYVSVSVIWHIELVIESQVLDGSDLHFFNAYTGATQFFFIPHYQLNMVVTCVLILSLNWMNIKLSCNQHITDNNNWCKNNPTLKVCLRV